MPDRVQPRCVRILVERPRPHRILHPMLTVIRRSLSWSGAEEGKDKNDGCGGREDEDGPLSYTHGMDMPFDWLDGLWGGSG
jgi:hypothetical protein